LELRVDGGLRRSYSNELRGLVAGSACENPILFAAPAYPAAGRITKNGEQISFVSGESSGEHAVNAIPLLFGDRPAMIVPHEVSSMGAESIAQWITRGLHRTRNVLGDAESDQNLRALAGAAALLTHDHDVITLSSGAWLQFHPVLPARPEFVLVAMGLPTCSNERQLSQLLKGARRKLVFPREALSMSLYGGGLAEIIRRAETIIIKAQPRDDTDPTVPVDGRARLEAANDVANAVAAMLETAHGLGVRCRGIVATGDHTASSVVVGLAANAIEPVRELVPHCAVKDEYQVVSGQDCRSS
jgi:uncharacterized protein YgbK (DUF1537 family)